MSAHVLLNLSYYPRTTLKTHFLRENAKILPYICDVITAVNT